MSSKKHVSQSKLRQRASRRALKATLYACKGCSKPIRGDHLVHHAPVCTGNRSAARRQLELLFEQTTVAKTA